MTSYPPIAYPTLLESPDSSVYLLINYSHFLCFSTQLEFVGSSWSDGRGSMICTIPFLIKNFNSKVDRENRKCSARSVWNFSFTVSTEVLSSTACSSQKSSLIFSNHFDKFVLPLQIIFSSNCCSLISSSFLIQEFLQKLGHWFDKIFMCLCEKSFFYLCDC